MLGFIRKGSRRLYYAWGAAVAKVRNPETVIGRGCEICPTAIFYKGGKIVLGDRCQVRHGVLLMPGRGDGVIEFGNDSTIHPYSVIAGTGGVHIGNGVRMSWHVIIMSHNHVFERLDVPIYKQGIETAPVVIEDDVWIGARVTIVPGVRIGTGAVIGAGAVVTSDIPPRGIAVGVPARVIRFRGEGEPHPADDVPAAAAR